MKLRMFGLVLSVVMLGSAPASAGYVHNDPINSIDPTGQETYVLTRPALGPQQRETAFFVGSRLGYVSSRLQGNEDSVARMDALLTGLVASQASHAFAVVTPEGVPLASADINDVQVFSWGPANDGTGILGLGNNIAQPPGSGIHSSDLAATQSFIDGSGFQSDLTAAGTTWITATEIPGVTNQQAIHVLTAQTAPTLYFPVPSLVPGTTNSNSELALRALSLDPNFQTSSTVALPGAQEATRLRPED